MPVPLIIPSHLFVSPADLSRGGTSLPTYRRRLADELGFYRETTVSAVSAGGEARRVVVSEDLRDDEFDTQLGAQWLYVRTGAQAGQQRRIITLPDTGYQGPWGVVMLSKPFAAPLAVGDVVELTAPLPVKRYLTTKGLDDCVNLALARSWISATFDLLGESTDAYPLASDQYLEFGDRQVRGLADRALGPWSSEGTRDPYPRVGAERLWVESDGINRTLVTEGRPGTGEQFGLNVIVRGDRLTYNGLEWSYLSDDAPLGLHAETDKAAVPESWVLAIGMVKALEATEMMLLHLPSGMDPDARQRAVADIRSRRARWAAVAASIKRTEMPKAGPRPAVPFVSVASV